jgi:AcrR family transcriptional regulator
VGSRERKERERDSRRDEILKAGEKLFLEKGLFATTMDEIARECELAKGTLYLYFKSKEQLYLTILLRALSIMQELMNASQDGVSHPVRRLEMIGDAHFRFYRENPGYFKLLYSATDSSSFHREDLREVGEMIKKKNEEIMTLNTSIIVDGIKEGVFRRGTDPAEIALGLHSISTTMTMMMNQADDDDKDQERGAWAFSRETLKRTMHRTCGRLIYTILADPPDIELFMEKGNSGGKSVKKKVRSGAKEAS